MNTLRKLSALHMDPPPNESHKVVFGQVRVGAGLESINAVLRHCTKITFSVQDDELGLILLVAHNSDKSDLACAAGDADVKERYTVIPQTYPCGLQSGAHIDGPIIARKSVRTKASQYHYNVKIVPQKCSPSCAEQ